MNFQFPPDVASSAKPTKSIRFPLSIASPDRPVTNLRLAPLFVSLALLISAPDLRQRLDFLPDGKSHSRLAPFVLFPAVPAANFRSLVR
jgi:hypothetical protein